MLHSQSLSFIPHFNASCDQFHLHLGLLFLISAGKKNKNKNKVLSTSPRKDWKGQFIILQTVGNSHYHSSVNWNVISYFSCTLGTGLSAMPGGGWLAISVKVKVKSLSRVWLFETPWTVAYQAPPSMGFSRQECWSGLPFPSPRESSRPRNRTQVSHIAGRRFTVWATREAISVVVNNS